MPSTSRSKTSLTCFAGSGVPAAAFWPNADAEMTTMSKKMYGTLSIFTILNEQRSIAIDIIDHHYSRVVSSDPDLYQIVLWQPSFARIREFPIRYKSSRTNNLLLKPFGASWECFLHRPQVTV